MNALADFAHAAPPFLEWLARASLSAAGIAILVAAAQFAFGRRISPAWRGRWGRPGANCGSSIVG